jgi:hypothetical protein
VIRGFLFVSAGTHPFPPPAKKLDKSGTIQIGIAEFNLSLQARKHSPEVFAD